MEENIWIAYIFYLLSRSSQLGEAEQLSCDQKKEEKKKNRRRSRQNRTLRNVVSKSHFCPREPVWMGRILPLQYKHGRDLFRKTPLRPSTHLICIHSSSSPIFEQGTKVKPILHSKAFFPTWSSNRQSNVKWHMLGGCTSTSPASSPAVSFLNFALFQLKKHDRRWQGHKHKVWKGGKGEMGVVWQNASKRSERLHREEVMRKEAKEAEEATEWSEERPWGHATKRCRNEFQQVHWHKRTQEKATSG